MIAVIWERYYQQDFFSQMDINIFLMRLQEQDDYVASWSDSTVKKIRQVMMRTLVENEYLDGIKAEKLNLVWLNPVLENAIKLNGDLDALPAFDYFFIKGKTVHEQYK